MTVHYRQTSKHPLTARANPVHSASRAARSGLYRRSGKRVFDLLIVLLAAPLVLPLVAIMALLVARDGASPFYVQIRIGAEGRPYRMWKLRSMVLDAEQKLEDHLANDAAARAEWAHHQKLKTDPRITAFGRILRRTSLDELPQLWNVLRGEMSLVGPRPIMLSQQSLYLGRDYYSLRPGMTGLWQVSARNRASFAKRASYDTAYNQDLSLICDLRILAQTVPVVLEAKGY